MKEIIAQIIDLKLLDAALYAELTKHITRLDLACEVSYERWSKFKFRRHVLSLDRDLMLADTVHRERVIECVASTLSALLQRDCSDTHAYVLSRASTQDVEYLLYHLWLNELTGQRACAALLRKEIDRMIDSRIFLSSSI